VRWVLRVILNGLAVVCGLGFAAAVAMGVRSYRVHERWVWTYGRAKDQSGYGDVNVWSSSGGIGVFVTRYEGLAGIDLWPPYHDRAAMSEYPYVPIPELSHGRGFVVGGVTLFRGTPTPLTSFVGEGMPASTQRVVIVPYWLIAAVATPLPAWRVVVGVRRSRRRRRVRRGLCAACGYDLRASAGRCPECGRVVEQLDG
jgi:hypothetical protein